jgi:hypothetical protein
VNTGVSLRPYEIFSFCSFLDHDLADLAYRPEREISSVVGAEDLAPLEMWHLSDLK